MSGIVMLNVGARGTGKTTTNKKLLEKVHPQARLVLDPNQEYTDLYPHPYIDFEVFARKLKTVRNAVIVIEEATIYLNTRGWNGDITSILVQARHRGNTIVFSFHSVQDIPKYVFRLSNKMILHKTGDVDAVVKQYNNKELYDAYLWLKTQPNLKGENGKEYSPQKILSLY